MSSQPKSPQSPSLPSPSTTDPISLSISMSTAATTHTLPTPAHSVSGTLAQTTDKSRDAGVILESPNKRKRDMTDTGDRELKKAHLESAELDIGNLHLDVGPKYLLLSTRKAPSSPGSLSAPSLPCGACRLVAMAGCRVVSSVVLAC
jgi:hypothetical protein